MKRSLIVLAVLLLVLPRALQAQYFHLGPVVGAGASMETQKGKLLDAEFTTKGKMIFHFRAGLDVMLQLQQDHGFEVLSGLSFLREGGTIESVENSALKLNFKPTTTTFYSLMVPVRVGYSHFFGSVGIYANLGPQFHIPLFGEVTTGDTKTKIDFSGKETTVQELLNEGVKPKLKRFGLTMSFHAGVTFKSFPMRIGAYYDLGLLSMNTAEHVKTTFSNFGAVAAFMF